MKKQDTFGLVITSYNRPELLKESLLQLEKTIWPKEFDAGHIVIIDDNSQDIETLRIIAEWNPTLPENWKTHKLMQRQNGNMFVTLPIGFEYLIKLGCNVLCNLDNDILCKPFWLQKLYSLYLKFPDHIITGFNAYVEKPHDIEKDKITFPLGYVEKMATSGINLMFNIVSYYKYFVSAFDEKLYWDWKVCDNYHKLDGKLTITAAPSCIQHAGIKSSLGKPESEAAIASDYDNADPFYDKNIAVPVKTKQKNKNAPELDVIILSWAVNEDFRKVTQTAIDTLLSSEKDKKINIIIVESNNDAKPYGKHKTLYYYKETKAEKFIYNKAVNLALSHLSGADYIAVCNNDLTFHENWFTILQEAMVTGGFKSACPIAPGFRGQLKFEDIIKPVEGYTVTEHFGGWCFVLDREVLHAIGGKLNENVDFWYSDNVYVDQLIHAKIRHALIPQSKVSHIESKTLYSGIIPPQQVNLLTGDQKLKYEQQKEVFEAKNFQSSDPEKILNTIYPSKKPEIKEDGPIMEYSVSKFAGKGKKVFKHSGNVGDVICSLPAVKLMSNEATILLNVNPESQKQIGSSMSLEYANMLKPLLLSQPYISKVDFYTEGMHIDYDLDIFRIAFRAGQKNLPYAYLQAFNLPLAAAHEKWLYLQKSGSSQYPAIINRTSRYHANLGTGWISLFGMYMPQTNKSKSEVAFIGLYEEFNAFVTNFGRKIDYIPTTDFLQVAHLINNCECFAGNGSVCYTIAEGLKHPNLVLEANAENDTISFDRPGVSKFY